MLVALDGRERVEAADASRGPEFRCPGCRSEVILKQGLKRIAHFAHKPPVTCDWAKGETEAHLKAKLAFRDAFRSRGIAADIEQEVLSGSGDRRADVLLNGPDGKRIAIEIQHTPIDPRDILRRTEAYMAAGVAVVWVCLPPKKVWEGLTASKSGGRLIRKYSPREWERWAHGYGFGGLWFFDPDSGNAYHGKFDAHRIEVETRSWYDEYGDEQYGGGYTRFSKRYKDLNLSGPFPLADLRIKRSTRTRSTFGKHVYPGGPFASLKVPGTE